MNRPSSPSSFALFRGFSLMLALTAALTVALTVATGARADQSYDEEGVNLVIARASRQAQENCAKTRGPDGRFAGPWGTVKLTVVLSHGSGRVKDVFVDDAFDETATGRCVENAFKTLIVGPWSGKDVTIEREVALPKPPEAVEEERSAAKRGADKTQVKGKKK